MRVSEFMQPARRHKAGPRHRTDYRAARRNIAKIGYRKSKRAIAAQAKAA
jgi:hypothetical protein